MNPIGGDEFAALQVEAGPRLGHAAKGHFLDGLAGGRIHDGGDDTHRQADTDGRTHLSMAAVNKSLLAIGSCHDSRFAPRAAIRCPEFASWKWSLAHAALPK